MHHGPIERSCRHVVVLLGCFILTASACTQSGWSGWINDRASSNATLISGSPSSRQYGGDEEDMNSTAREAFCAAGHGLITNIVCVTANNETDYIKSQGSQGMNCRIGTGFVCMNHDVTGGTCMDYKIKVFCNCTNPLAPLGVGVAGTTPGTNNGVTQQHLGDGNGVILPACSYLLFIITSLIWFYA